MAASDKRAVERRPFADRDRKASAHYFVGYDGEIWQSVEDEDWYFEDATVEAAVELTCYLMDKYNVPESRVLRHYDVTGKICPAPYVHNKGQHTWEEFQNAIGSKKGKVDGIGLLNNLLARIRNPMILRQHDREELVNGCVDPRYAYVEKGCAPYVEWLGQKENPQGKGWASGQGYGAKICRILNEMKKQ